MKSIRKFFEHQKNVLIIIILGIITLLPVFFSNLTSNPTLWYLVEWFFWIVVLFIQRIDRLNFEWNRFWLWLWNSSVSWSMTGEFSAEVTKESFKESITNVIKIYPDAKYWHQTEDEAILKLPELGGNIRFFTTSVQNSIDTSEILYIFEISDLFVPFRQSEKSLNFIISIIEYALKPAIQPQNEKYTLRVKFGDTNPYFGLFIRKFKIDEKNSLTFRVQFKEIENLSQGNVEVSKEKITLVTQNLMGLKLFSQKYITLSSLDLFHS